MDVRLLYRGSQEYLEALVTVTGTSLVAQPVEFSFNREDWLDAEWFGDPGSSRVARIFLDDTTTPEATSPVYVRVTDNPEIPVVKAGTLKIR